MLGIVEVVLKSHAIYRCEDCEEMYGIEFRAVQSLGAFDVIKSARFLAWCAVHEACGMEELDKRLQSAESSFTSSVESTKTP